MPTSKTLNNLVINKVESQEIYQNLVETGRINADELYLVEGEDISFIKDVQLNGSSVVENQIANIVDATAASSGLMSAEDKSKIDGIENGANNYVLPMAGIDFGGVKSGGDVSIANGVITVNDDSHNHVIDNIDGLQDALDDKAQSNHKHSAEDIVSGVLSISHGGHGASTAADARINLGITPENIGAAPTEHTHDDRYYTETEIDSKLNDKADSTHVHTIDNITGLQSVLDEKAASSHSHSVATTLADGFMSAADKQKLDGIDIVGMTEEEIDAMFEM